MLTFAMFLERALKLKRFFIQSRGSVKVAGEVGNVPILSKGGNAAPWM